jgi:hypothetical protein
MLFSMTMQMFDYYLMMETTLLLDQLPIPIPQLQKIVYEEVLQRI